MKDSSDVFALAKDLRVLVTAGASGIGRAIRDLLAARGARLHICDVSDDFLADYRAAHWDARVTKADVASESDVAHLFVDAKASLGGLDALINKAGIAGPTGGVEDIMPEEWRRTIDVCLTGQFLCAHRGVPMLKAAGGDAIVNLSEPVIVQRHAARQPATGGLALGKPLQFARRPHAFDRRIKPQRKQDRGIGGRPSPFALARENLIVKGRKIEALDETPHEARAMVSGKRPSRSTMSQRR
jgi:hypothetical protein